MLLVPASSGTGIIAGAAVRAVCEAAGIRDILSKSYGSSNPVTVVKATIAALGLLRSPRKSSVCEEFRCHESSTMCIAGSRKTAAAAAWARHRVGAGKDGRPRTQRAEVAVRLVPAVHLPGRAMPLVRRVPKRGFNNRFALEVAVVNVGDLEAFFQPGDEVSPESLRKNPWPNGPTTS